MSARTILTSVASTLALLGLLGGTALADGGPDGRVARPATLAGVPIAPRGFGMQFGGGVTGFVQQDARELFATGGYWDVRAVLGGRSLLAAELAYVGSARDVTTAGVGRQASLMADGGEAALRANLPLQAGTLRVEPFVFGGVGWSYYQLANEEAGSADRFADHFSALALPFGAGVSATQDHLLIDLRFTYRPVLDGRPVRMDGGEHDTADLESWAVGLTVGFEI